MPGKGMEKGTHCLGKMAKIQNVLFLCSAYCFPISCSITVLGYFMKHSSNILLINLDMEIWNLALENVWNFILT